tara:strand:+ start:409 stop:900 length:492 start_codon:yes stop_codon:yes gene_type:complete
MFDATFWVAISFVIFIILILYKKVPKFVLNQIDIKISELKNKIDEAENLKSSSEKLLSNIQGKLEKSEKESSEILRKAQKISEEEIEITKEKMQRSLENKETAAFNKINQAKSDAISQIKKEATEIAIETVKKVITENLDVKKQEEINLLKLKNSMKKLENTN